MRASGISNLSRHSGSVSWPADRGEPRQPYRDSVAGRGGVCPLEGQAHDPAGVAQLVEHLFCKQAVRGSSPLAGSHASARRTRNPRSFCVRARARLTLSPSLLEGCPSGQREQAVNLPDFSYVGSNPTPSTPFFQHRGLNGCSGSGPVLPLDSAGVAQLVERQPSKLNVEGSSPFSRSAKRFAKMCLREWRSVQGSAPLTSTSPT
jgi:hypothetical protein